MRTLSATLLAKQKSPQFEPLYKVTLTREGNPTYTYDRTRILAIDPHDEQSYSQKASVYLNNSDQVLTAIDLKGYQAVISYGQKTTAGEEYSDCAPLYVIGQKFNSIPGELDCILILEGILDLMVEDRASQSYTPNDSDTKTVKTLLTEIITATMTCFNHCTAYEVVFDSEDSLIDSYQPKRSFRIYTNGARLAALRRLLDYTGCTMLVKADGKIHIFVPITSGAVYDYEYSLTSGYHTFFAKTYTKRLVIPNYIVVKSNDGDSPAYSGYATDPSSTLLEKREYHQMALTSNDQATSIASAMMSKAQIQAEGGSGSVPLNAGAEVLDYVLITDVREGDSRSGNIGYIRRRVNPRKSTWTMTFGFGGWTSFRGLLNDLTTSDVGASFEGLSVKNLYAENIQANQLDIVWIDPEGNIDLSKIGDNLDNLPDGETYARVKSVHLDSGGLKIDDACIYKAGYDPSGKMPGDADLDDIPNGSVYSRVKSTALTADGLVLLDQVSIGSIYGLVNKTDISAGHVLLSSTTESSTARKVSDTEKGTWNGKPSNMDDIGDGSYYKKVLATEISSGYLKLTSNTVKSGQWYNESGVIIDAGVGIKIAGALDLQFNNGGNTGYIYEDASGRLSLYSYYGVDIWHLYCEGLISDIIPNAANAYAIGNASYPLYQLAATNIYRTNEWNLDSLNDLEVIKAMKAKKDNPELLDTDTIHPYLLFAADDSAKMISKVTERGNKIIQDLTLALSRDKISDAKKAQIQSEIVKIQTASQQRIAQIQTDTANAKPMIDTGKMSGLQLGAIKQLILRVEALEKELSDSKEKSSG